jgi:hypothetical protein
MIAQLNQNALFFCSMTFSDSRAKIERADEHISELEKRLADLPNSYISRVEINPDFSYQTLVHDIVDRDKFLTQIALMIGDAVHNLKCALDYAWIKTIEIAAPSALGNFAKFPVYPTREGLEAALRGTKIHVSCPRLFDLMLDEIRPYQRGNFAVWEVYVLDKRDKHRLLIPLQPYGNISGIELQDESGVIHRGSTWGTDQPLPYYVTFATNLSVKDKGKLFFSIAIDETLFAGAPGVQDTFSMHSRMILEVVQSLEAFVETI